VNRTSPKGFDGMRVSKWQSLDLKQETITAIGGYSHVSIHADHDRQNNPKVFAEQAKRLSPSLPTSREKP